MSYANAGAVQPLATSQATGLAHQQQQQPVPTVHSPVQGMRTQAPLGPYQYPPVQSQQQQQPPSPVQPQQYMGSPQQQPQHYMGSPQQQPQQYMVGSPQQHYHPVPTPGFSPTPTGFAPPQQPQFAPPNTNDFDFDLNDLNLDDLDSTAPATDDFSRMRRMIEERDDKIAKLELQLSEKKTEDKHSKEQGYAGSKHEIDALRRQNRDLMTQIQDLMDTNEVTKRQLDAQREDHKLAVQKLHACRAELEQIKMANGIIEARNKHTPQNPQNPQHMRDTTDEENMGPVALRLLLKQSRRKNKEFVEHLGKALKEIDRLKSEVKNKDELAKKYGATASDIKATQERRLSVMTDDVSSERDKFRRLSMQFDAFKTEHAAFKKKSAEELEVEVKKWKEKFSKEREAAHEGKLAEKELADCELRLNAWKARYAALESSLSEYSFADLEHLNMDAAHQLKTVLSSPSPDLEIDAKQPKKMSIMENTLSQMTRRRSTLQPNAIEVRRKIVIEELNNPVSQTCIEEISDIFDEAGEDLAHELDIPQNVKVEFNHKGGKRVEVVMTARPPDPTRSLPANYNPLTVQKDLERKIESRSADRIIQMAIKSIAIKVAEDLEEQLEEEEMTNLVADRKQRATAAKQEWEYAQARKEQKLRRDVGKEEASPPGREKARSRRDSYAMSTGLGSLEEEADTKKETAKRSRQASPSSKEWDQLSQKERELAQKEQDLQRQEHINSLKDSRQNFRRESQMIVDEETKRLDEQMAGMRNKFRRDSEMLKSQHEEQINSWRTQQESFRKEIEAQKLLEKERRAEAKQAGTFTGFADNPDEIKRPKPKEREPLRLQESRQDFHRPSVFEGPKKSEKRVLRLQESRQDFHRPSVFEGPKISSSVSSSVSSSLLPSSNEVDQIINLPHEAVSRELVVRRKEVQQLKKRVRVLEQDNSKLLQDLLAATSVDAVQGSGAGRSVGAGHSLNEHRVAGELFIELQEPVSKRHMESLIPSLKTRLCDAVSSTVVAGVYCPPHQVDVALRGSESHWKCELAFRGLNISQSETLRTSLHDVDKRNRLNDIMKSAPFLNPSVDSGPRSIRFEVKDVDQAVTSLQNHNQKLQHELSTLRRQSQIQQHSFGGGGQNLFGSPHTPNHNHSQSQLPHNVAELQRALEAAHAEHESQQEAWETDMNALRRQFESAENTIEVKNAKLEAQKAKLEAQQQKIAAIQATAGAGQEVEAGGGTRLTPLRLSDREESLRSADPEWARLSREKEHQWLLEDKTLSAESNLRKLQSRAAAMAKEWATRVAELEEQVMQYSQLMPERDARIEAQRKLVAQLQAGIAKQAVVIRGLESQLAKYHNEVMKLRSIVAQSRTGEIRIREQVNGFIKDYVNHAASPTKR